MRARPTRPRRLLRIASALVLLAVALCLGVYLRFPKESRTAVRRVKAWQHQVLARDSVRSPRPAGPGTRVSTALHVTERIYDDGLHTPVWEDDGDPPREISHDGPARLRLPNRNRWVLARSSPVQPAYGGLLIRMKAPQAFGDFLNVQLASDVIDNFPVVQIAARHRRDLEEGWSEVFVSMAELNPFDLDFDGLSLGTAFDLPDEWIVISSVGLTASDGTKPPARSLPSRTERAIVACDRPTRPISPLIYGLADVSASEDLNATAYRWGGNPMTRYNWKLDAYNTASDWYFENVKVSSWERFLDRALQREAYVSLTVPIIGWVAKDTTSVAFPVSRFGQQASMDVAYRPEAGNGVFPDGTEVAPGSPEMTSVAAPPEFVAEWVRTIRAQDESRGVRRVHAYILDNEPSLWSSTHRDVHPEPLTYDELLDRTIRYASAIRAADPSAVIAGPALWGWPAYFDSAKDQRDSLLGYKPDRAAHGGVPILAYYLRTLAEHEKQTGVRLLDVVDVHFYPQAKGVYSAASDDETVGYRLRATRSLWDKTYRDESWIDEEIQLIPRMLALIRENYPGRGLSLGEWSFGGEKHLSGGLATAEALGRFAQQGLTSAYYWIAPPAHSPAYWAFRAFRNYDGAGSHFLEHFVETKHAQGISVFASRNESGTRAVVVVINPSRTHEAALELDLSRCGAAQRVEAFSYWGARGGLGPLSGVTHDDTHIRIRTQPQSVSVIEVDVRVTGPRGRTREAPMAGETAR